MTGDAIAALHDVLGHAGIRSYLFGAQAALLHGVPRLTADVDATAEFPLDRAEELSRLLMEGGFAVRVGDVQAFVRRTRVIPLTHIASGVPVQQAPTAKTPGS